MKKTISVSAWILVALWPVLASAQVRVGLSSEGRKIIFNEGVADRARRLSDRLVPIPKADIQIAIDRHAQAQSLDPKLVRAVVQVESGYNHRARSQKGAMGLMQLMPATASLYSVEDPYDPDENVRGGTRYLRYLVDRFPGRLDLAVAAYNAGPAAVDRYGGVPPYRETKDYVRRVLALYQGGTQVSFPPTTTPKVGVQTIIPGRRKPYITRNSQNRIVVTTAIDTRR
ncbi:MAG TPA: lytic transglycosylase domain-containing protein [Thermoanaerobaculia bacterium]|jgi:soluble lytic murein transglycosylase|nr:lytic transglycosylase domain-containing protein [Thermoanaerobaculia bacterium]